MKKLVIACLIITGLIAAVPAKAKARANAQASKKLAAAFRDVEVKDDGLRMVFTVRHDERGRYTPPGVIRPLQIFPINSVAGGLTYDFS